VIDEAIANGRTLDEFTRDLEPVLQQNGWWGRGWMVDPGNRRGAGGTAVQ
jgi:hypothetical protein